ncbi:MAG: hypothetical protein KDI01_11555 [Halioglobus sp.]|nr:hypothetical protein [Halioglobus sp.]
MVMDTVPDEFSQLLLSIYQDATAEHPWKDFCKYFPRAIARRNFSIIIRSPSEHSKGQVLLRVRVSRHRGEPPFAEKEKKLLWQLLPHMDRANRIHRGAMIFNTTSNLVNDILDNRNTALVVIDESMSILVANPQAEALFDWCDAVHRHDGRFAMGNCRYQRMIATVRTQLRALLSKTGVSRQSELIWLIWQSAI